MKSCASENIALVSEKKVEEYESRIASLEYQLEACSNAR